MTEVCKRKTQKQSTRNQNPKLLKTWRNKTNPVPSREVCGGGRSRTVEGQWTRGPSVSWVADVHDFVFGGPHLHRRSDGETKTLGPIKSPLVGAPSSRRQKDGVRI